MYKKEKSFGGKGLEEFQNIGLVIKGMRNFVKEFVQNNSQDINNPAEVERLLGSYTLFLGLKLGFKFIYI